MVGGSDSMLSPDTQILPENGLTILDFWAWAYSDILSNSNRGVFAEFLVGSALGVSDTPRVEWDAYDLLYQGRKIEVKSSAYLQSWSQTKPSTIKFDIAMKKGWEAATNVSAVEADRSADIYIFCVFTEQDRELINVLDTTQWEFYVVPVDKLNELGKQKSIGLKPLQKLATVVAYADLKQAVDALLG